MTKDITTLIRDMKHVLNYDPNTGVFIWSNGKSAGGLNKYGYRIIGYKNKRYYAHRLAFLFMTGEIPEQVDHINQDKSDNRWSNLRASDNKSNSRNKRLNTNNSTGVCGVYYDKRYDVYVGEVTKSGKKHYAGSSKDLSVVESKIKELRKELGFSEIHGQKY